jgi:hypothetical protein
MSESLEKKGGAGRKAAAEHPPLTPTPTPAVHRERGQRLVWRARPRLLSPPRHY